MFTLTYLEKTTPTEGHYHLLDQEFHFDVSERWVGERSLMRKDLRTEQKLWRAGKRRRGGGRGGIWWALGWWAGGGEASYQDDHGISEIDGMDKRDFERTASMKQLLKHFGFLCCLESLWTIFGAQRFSSPHAASLCNCLLRQQPEFYCHLLSNQQQRIQGRCVTMEIIVLG